MLVAFKEFLEGLSQPGREASGDKGVRSVLTEKARIALIRLTRSVYGETAAQVVTDSCVAQKNGGYILSRDLLEAFSASIKGPT